MTCVLWDIETGQKITEFADHLGDVMSAHFAAAVPNLRTMEIDIDEVPWKWDFLDGRLALADGHLAIPQGPGWGLEVVESALAAHPPT